MILSEASQSTIGGKQLPLVPSLTEEISAFIMILVAEFMPMKVAPFLLDLSNKVSEFFDNAWKRRCRMEEVIDQISQ